ncbi:hypothetical protein PROFUN_02250 [Planoprotostelium fungivorum]|uniref:Ras-GEF domain-containing protein n=1 Tax=Planoprotostelium fungivorum TaxID=1890364 RepID=A0A2P6NYG8_9EUKA|nr:hypothetical protein PROFUN_02250 [Planoprotostelium fungivorum]
MLHSIRPVFYNTTISRRPTPRGLFRPHSSIPFTALRGHSPAHIESTIDLPKGLDINPSFLTQAEHDDMVEEILDLFDGGGQIKSNPVFSRRMTNVYPASKIADKLPQTKKIIDRVFLEENLHSQAPDAVQINEYEEDGGCPMHTDAGSIGSVIAMFSFLSPCVMDFGLKDKKTEGTPPIRVLLEPRSLLPSKTHEFNGKKIEKGHSRILNRAPVCEIRGALSLKVLRSLKNCTPDRLLTLWEGLEAETKQRKDTQQRNSVLSFFLIWMSLFWFTDFSSKTRKRLIDRFQGFHNRNEFNLLLIRLYRNRERKPVVVSQTLEGRLRTELQGKNTITITEKKSEHDSITPGGSMSNYDTIQSNHSTPSQAEPTALSDFFRYTPREIASSLAIQFDQCFLQLEPVDFLNRIGWGVKKEDKSSALHDMVTLFNKTSGWVVTEILRQKDPVIQSGMVDKFLQIAKKSESLGNFDCALALLSGLNNFGVQRLRQLWDNLSDRSHAIFASLEELFSPVNNFRLYHDAVQQRKPPSIPYVGLIMRDFTFIVEGDAASRDHGLPAGRSMWLKWSWVTTLQKEFYRLPVPAALVDFMKNVQVIENDEDIHILSMQLANRSRDDISRHDSMSSASTMPTVHTEESFPNMDVRVRSSISSRSSQLSPAEHHVRKNKAQFERQKSEKKYEDKMEKKNGDDPSKKPLRHLRLVTVNRAISGPWVSVEKTMDTIYDMTQRSTDKGSLLLAQTRHILIRSGSISVDLWSAFSSLFPDQILTRSRADKGVQRLALEIGTAVGKGDATWFSRKFLQQLEQPDGLHFLAAASIQSALLGWGRWRISSVSSTLDQNHFRINYRLINSFESQSWSIANTSNVCQMSAGYASGWISTALGTYLRFPVSVVEITCKTSGSKHCTFVGCPTQLVEQVTKECAQVESVDMETIHAPSQLGDLTAPPHTPNRRDTISMHNSLFSSIGRLKGLRLRSPTLSAEEILISPEQLEERSSRYRVSMYGGLYSEPTTPSISFESRPDIRHIFIRAESFSSGLFSHLISKFGTEDTGITGAAHFIYQFGRMCAVGDLKYYNEEISWNSPQERMYFLSQVLLESGWGKLKISQVTTKLSKTLGTLQTTGRMVITRNAEATAWQGCRVRLSSAATDTPLCLYTSGYIAGWLSESFSTSIAVVEVECSACRAKTSEEERCEFVFAPAGKITEETKKAAVELGQPGIHHLLGIAVQAPSAHLFESALGL